MRATEREIDEYIDEVIGDGPDAWDRVRRVVEIQAGMDRRRRWALRILAAAVLGFAAAWIGCAL